MGSALVVVATWMPLLRGVLVESETEVDAEMSTCWGLGVNRSG